MNAKKILVTGGAGFVGSNLCASLLEQGHEVLCLDNFYTGSMKNITPLLKNPRFQLIEKDVMLPFYEEVDQVYNLACPASPIHYQKDPVLTIRTSFLGTQNCLELAKKCGATVLQASTSEVYGDPEVHPQSESYRGCVNTLGIRACYDEGKRCAETLMMDYHRQYGVDVKIVRIFNTYGPNMEINDFQFYCASTSESRYNDVWRWTANSFFPVYRRPCSWHSVVDEFTSWVYRSRKYR